MEKENPAAIQVPLTAGEMQVIDQFRRLKSTAVLTILFTDIKGFTQMTEVQGEAYSNKLRKHHDDVVVPVIERDGGGRVVKHIGDSVMAVFSEPSTAVARAIEVQEKLAAFNREHPELEDINVRMGLHSGQVTTEDDVNADVFGRHVNRAARVEALADGGQILVTYAVYDSARGWLNDKSDKPVGWEKHGRYMLKGIPEPIDIYEPYNPKLTKPKAPAGAMKTGGTALGKLAALGVGLMLAVAAATFVFIQVSNITPEISVVDYGSDIGTLETGEKFQLDGERGQHIRKALVPVKKGPHLLSVDISYMVRAFAPFEVKPGKNVIEMKFKRVQLPGMTRRIDYNPEGPNTLQEGEDAEYTSYDAKMTPKENKAHINMSLKAEPDPADAKRVKFTCNYTVLVNGTAVTQGAVTDYNQLDNSETRSVPEKVLWNDDFHYFYISYYMSGGSAEFTVGSAFADYMKK